MADDAGMGRLAATLGGAPAPVGADVATGVVGPGEPDPEFALPAAPIGVATLEAPARLAEVTKGGEPEAEACGAAEGAVALDPSVVAVALVASRS